MLNIYDEIPQGLLEAESTDLLELLGKPTLIHLQGSNPQPLFVSTLLHGDETTGFYAIKRLLERYSNTSLPRSLSIFFGNVDAAASYVRRLDTQVDYNRAWPGTHHSDCAETDLLRTVTEIMRKQNPFASIDIHNNTGQNPHYGCVNILNPHCLHLAAMFSDITVYFTSPKGTQSSSFSDFCPAVVLECGQSGEKDSVEHAVDYLDSVLCMETMPGGHPSHRLYHTVARVTIPDIVDFGINDSDELQLDTGLESRNFDTLQPGTQFAHTRLDDVPFIVKNESSEDVTHEFFELNDSTVILKRDVTLSMYTTNTRAIRQDCLCYFMERLNIGN